MEGRIGEIENDHSNGILIKTGEHTQAARPIRFTNVQEIVKMDPS
jgi:uncharacterized protein YdeI (YjbR/CyaY-like superfamily)